jgi:hypothetical protein
MICDRPDWTLQAVLRISSGEYTTDLSFCASLFSPQLRLRVCIEGINDVCPILAAADHQPALIGELLKH